MGISQIGGSTESISGYTIGPIANTNTAYGAFGIFRIGSWAITTSPAAVGITVRAYSASGSLVGTATTVTGGTTNIAISSEATVIWVENRVAGTGEDGAITAISPPVDMSLSFRGLDMSEAVLTSFETITSSGVTPSKSGRATLVLVGGGMNGGASAGGTSVGGGGRTGHVNVIPDVFLTGSEVSSVSAAIAFGSSNTAGATTLGTYSSLSGTFATAADYGQNVTPIWENHKRYGTPAITGSTTAGRGGYNGNDWPAGSYRIGKGGNCGAGVTQNASGYGAGGGGGFWNGQGGGSGSPGVIYIAWL
jgi:hypothetical protein